MTPQLRARSPTRYVRETARGRSSAKNVSACGPSRTSTHSVSLGGATVGRSITRTIGCALPALTRSCAVRGYRSPLNRFSAVPG